MKNGKVKSFFAKHKTAFAVAAGVTTAVVTGAVSYNLGRNCIINSLSDGFFIHNSGVTAPACRVFDSLSDGAKIGLFGGCTDAPITADQLGELGKMMLESGVNKDDTFTHFIAIGER